MTMYYPNPNVTRPLDVFTYLNTITGDVFWTLIVFAIFIIVYIGLSIYNFKNALLPSFFISTFTSAMLYGAGLVSSWVVAALMLGSGLATLLVYLSSSSA